MYKLLLFIAAVLIAPQISFGAVVYDVGYGGSSINFVAGTITNATPYSGSPITFPLSSSWVTVTSPIDTLRIHRLSGASCSDLLGGGSLASNAAGTGMVLSGHYIDSVATVSDGGTGDYCDFHFHSSPFTGGNVAHLYLNNKTVTLEGAVSNGYVNSPSNYTVSSGAPAFQLCDSGTCGTFTTPSDGIVTPNEPTPNSVYLYNPVPFNGTYNNGIDNFYNLVQVQATSTALTLPLTFQYFLATSTGSSLTYSITDYNLPVEGMYGYQIRLMDTINSVQTPWVYGGSFGLATTTTATIDEYVTPVATTCSTFDFFCHLKKFGIWALFPSEGLINSYTSLLETIQSKPPIGYFTIVKNSITGLNASSTPEVEIVIPTQLKTIFFDPIDVALGSILWAAFAFLFYKRLKHITI